jgi:hypothetical protein
MMTSPIGVAIHYSGGLHDSDGRHSGCAAKVRSFQQHHMAPGGLNTERGGADIAYSWIVCPHGYVFEGRGWRYQSGANGTSAGNRNYYAVCLIGGDRAGRRDVTPEQWQATRDLAHDLRKRRPAARTVRPHSYFAGTGCPGDEIRRRLPELSRLLGA